MTSTRLLASLAAIGVAVWAPAACSSKSDDDDTGGSGNAGSSAGNGGSSHGGTQSSEGGSDASPEAGANEGGTSTGGTAPLGGEPAGGGDPGMAGTTGEAGAGAGTCTPDPDLTSDGQNCGRCGHDCGGGQCDHGRCLPVVVLDPAPRSMNRNTGLDVYQRFSIDGGSLYFWNYGYLPNMDFDYSILKASVTPTDPPANGQDDAVQSFPIVASPIQGATFAGGYLYFTIKTGAATAEVRRKKLDKSDADAGTKLFNLDGGRIWRGIAVDGTTVYLTGEVDTNTAGQMKVGVYASVNNAAPVAVTGLATLPEQVFDFTLVGGHLFWTQYDADTTHAFLYTAPVGGGTPVFIEDVTQFGGANVVGDLDGTHVYWTSHHHGGHLQRCAVDKLATADEVAQNAEELTGVDNATEGMAVDEQYVYYMEDETLITGKPLWRVSKAGGEHENLAEIDGGFGVVGVDESFVYVEDFDNRIYRVSKTP